MSSVKVDDRDPAIEYAGSWGPAGVPQEYRGTTHYPEANGSSFSYIFHGTSVSIFGTVQIFSDNISPMTSYAVDDLDPVFVTSPTTPTIIFNYDFYTSPLLENGQHTINVTAVSVSADSAAGFFFDYLEYIQIPDATTVVPSSTLVNMPASSPPSLPSSTPSSSSTAPSSSIPTNTPSSSSTMGPSSSIPLNMSNSLLTPLMTPGAQSSSTTTPQRIATPLSNAVDQKSRDELSVVLPATIAPVIFLLLVIVALVYCLRRRKSKSTSLNHQYSDNAPYDAFTEYPARPPRRRKSYFSPSHETRYRDAPPPMIVTTNEIGPDAPLPRGSSQERRPTGFEAHSGVDASFTAATTTETRYRRHLDGGKRIAGGPLSMVVEELPPEYGTY